MNIQWWGYLHSSGTIQVKRYFGDWDKILEDIDGNDFVVQAIEPFEAESREEAIEIILEKLKEYK